LLEAGQVDNLQRRKRRSLALLKLNLAAIGVVCLLRFVPPWNDRLAGQPQYAKVMTTLTAEELAKSAQDRFPVILLGEDERCDPPPPAAYTEDQFGGSLYLLTYSEPKHFACIMLCSVPLDPSKFTKLRTIRPEEGWTDGPRLLYPIKVLPIASSMHVFPPAYLELLHWRTTPRFPITESQAAGLASHKYESTNPSVQVGKGTFELDFQKARALIREPHDQVNFKLSLALIALLAVMLPSVLKLVRLYRKSSQYFQLSGHELWFEVFLFQDLSQVASVARTRYFQQQREQQIQQRKEEMLMSLRQELEEKLRSGFENLQDEHLRQRIVECINAQPPDLEGMKLLGEELQKTLEHKRPEERLALLVESLSPYCTQAELDTCLVEAQNILGQSGFREARKFVVATHDQFRLRAREREELEENAADSPKPSESIEDSR
jgi:hypothetical protein